MSLDLSKFSKVDSDDKCTTLAHPNGHMIKVAHKGLSKELKKQLEELPVSKAAGGPLEPKSAAHTRGAKPSKASQPQGMAEHSYNEPDDFGTHIPPEMLKQEMAHKQIPDVVVSALNKKAPPFGPLGAEKKEHYPPCINPSCKSYGSSHPNCRCYGGVPEAGHFAKGGDVKGDHFCSKDRQHQEGCEYFKDGGEAETEGEKLETAAQEVAPELHATPEPTPQPEVNPNPEVSGGAAAEGAEPSPQAATPFSNPVIEAEQDPVQKTLSHAIREGQAYQADVNSGAIKPETYHDLWAKKDTAGKIGTLFGLLVGGMGAGLAGQPNAIMQMMDNEIERDLKAQQESAKNKATFLSINGSNLEKLAAAGKIYGDLKALNIGISKSNMKYGIFNDVLQGINKLPDGQVKQQKLQALMIMKDQFDKDEGLAAQQWAAAQAIAAPGGAGGQPNTAAMKAFGPPSVQKYGEDIEAKTIPSIPGRATIPIPQHQRDQVQAMTVLDKKASDLLDYAKKHKGSLDPKVLKVGRQKAEEMMNYYNNSIQGGVMTEGRLAWLDKQIGKNPTSIFQDILGNNAQLKEIKDSNAMRADTLLKQYGHPGYPGAQQSAETKTINGAQYKKVHGGWQKVK